MTLRISLALQGGGAHGAFTWGVLDRLLDEEDIEIAAISGTSAGALNGAALKCGMLRGGRSEAKASLAALWEQVERLGDLRLGVWMTSAMPLAAAMTEVWENTFGSSPQGIAAQVISPYATGGHWTNPLEAVVNGFDFTNVCSSEGPYLSVSATNVRSGKIGVFAGAQITPQTLLASGCLPTVFQAVEAPDPKTGKMEHWWDGGYTGNPALFPLYEKNMPDDLVIVSINPLYRDDVPQTALAIQNRINEISFNAPLMRDFRAIGFVHRLIAEGKIAKGAMKDLRLHLIADDALMNDLSGSSKLLATPKLLARLRAAGGAAAERFLIDHRASLGKRSSVNLSALLD